MARLLIVGGGCRGLILAGRLHQEGHATRVITRDENRAAGIEAVGAQCWIGDPDRLATIRDALEGVTVLCWLLGTASGSSEQIAALHGPRLHSFLGLAIDSTVRGVVYEAAGGAVAPELLMAGASIARELTSRNSIPLRLIEVDPAHSEQWLECARAAIDSLLLGPRRLGAEEAVEAT